MRVRVDAGICQGHTLCKMTAPNIFELSETDGHAYVPQEAVAPEDEDLVRVAAQTCPEQAVILIEEDDSQA